MSNEAWSKWKRLELHESVVRALKEAYPTKELPKHIYSNGIYEVWVVENVAGPDFPKMNWLSIKRYDRAPIRDWRELQRIKNELVGKDYEAVELFPAESRKVDSSNQYHLWVLAKKGLKFPFGYTYRDVLTPEELAKSDLTGLARQEAFGPTHEAPTDREDDMDIEALKARADRIAKIKGVEENCSFTLALVLCAKPGKKLPTEAVVQSDIAITDQGEAIKNRYGETAHERRG